MHSQTHITGGFSYIRPSAYTIGKGRGVIFAEEVAQQLGFLLWGSLHLFPSWGVGTHKPRVHTRSMKYKLLLPRRVRGL